MENFPLIRVVGSLHSHGFWTDYKSWYEKYIPIFGAPFTLDYLVKKCMKYGMDFQGVLDIMAPEVFQERRYYDLIKTAKPNKRYEIESSKIETIVHFKDGQRFYIPRIQEVITENILAHILVLGLGEDNNVLGGRPVEDTLVDIQQKEGYAFLNHPLVCKVFTEDQILDFYERKLILGTEFNGGVTIGEKLEPLAYRIMLNPPLKKDNEKILNLEKKLLIVANNDARCKSDVKNGAYAEYLIEDNSNKSFTERIVNSMQNEIKEGLQGNYIKRNDSYSPWWSMWYHGACGRASKGLPRL